MTSSVISVAIISTATEQGTTVYSPEGGGEGDFGRELPRVRFELIRLQFLFNQKLNLLKDLTYVYLRQERSFNI